MDPVRSRVQAVHRKQRKKFYTAEELEWDRKVKRANRQANLLCVGFVALAAALAYLFSSRGF